DFSEEWVRGTHIRVYPTRLGDQYALQIARPLTEVDRSLAALRAVLVVIALGGVALAALLGRAIARAALAPIHRLGAAVDHVTETQDITQRVPDQGQDELSRLGGHFNRMLSALDEALRHQRQLVADRSAALAT